MGDRGHRSVAQALGAAWQVARQADADADADAAAVRGRLHEVQVSYASLLGLLALALRPEPTEPGAVLSIGGANALALWQAGDERGMSRLRALWLGFVPQTAALLNFLTLRENIALPQRIADRIDPSYLAEIAGVLGLSHILDRRPADVSVGQRQRAAIARAMAHRPAILLADEPTASVHPVVTTTWESGSVAQNRPSTTL